MNTRAIIAVLLIVLAAIALIAHLSTTTIEFSRYNGDWTGTSGLFADLDARGARDLVSYDDLAGRNDTLFLIIAPNSSFPAGEAAALRRFLEDGNTVVIADETGVANDLLERLGSSIRIQPGDISSTEMEFFDYWSVIVYPRHDDPLLANVSAITLNRPSAVNGGESLVRTTLLSWDDTNANYHLDANETLSSFSILAREPVGRGTLYVFSDPSIFVNGMRQARLTSDNAVFTKNLLSLQSGILVDQSHSLTGGADAVLATAIWVKNTMVIKISALIVSLLLVAVAFWRRWI